VLGKQDIYMQRLKLETYLSPFTKINPKWIKLCKQPRYPITDERIKKMWYLYTMEFYSATKKNEILSFAGKWMELENIILSEVRRFRRPKATCFLSYVEYRHNTNTAIL
jgi:hypothetical protein